MAYRGDSRVFLGGYSGTDILHGAYRNEEEAVVVCESRPDEKENILEDASPMDKNDDSVVLHEDDKNLGNTNGFSFEPTSPEKSNWLKNNTETILQDIDT